MSRRLAIDLGATVLISSASSVLSYLYLILCAHSLAAADFGALVTLVGFINVSAFIAVPLGMQVTRILAPLPRGRMSATWMRFWTATARHGAIATAAVALVALPFAGLIGVRPLALVLTAWTIYGYVLSVVASGLTSASGALRLQAGIGLLTALVKLSGAGLLFLITPSLLAGISAYGLGFLAACGATLLFSRTRGVAVDDGGEPVPFEGLASPHFGFLVLAYFLLYLPFSADQLLVQLFARAESGNYAAASTLGKISFYFLAPVLGVVYPHLTRAQGDGRAQKRVLLHGLAAAGLLGGAVVLVFAIAPDFIVRQLLPEQYGSTGLSIVLMAIASAIYGLASVVTMFGIVTLKRRLIPALALAQMAQVLLFRFSHETLLALVWNQIATCGLMLVCGAIAVLVDEPPPAV